MVAIFRLKANAGTGGKLSFAGSASRCSKDERGSADFLKDACIVRSRACRWAGPEWTFKVACTPINCGTTGGWRRTMINDQLLPGSKFDEKRRDELTREALKGCDEGRTFSQTEVEIWFKERREARRK
jgi:hypothetical protein